MGQANLFIFCVSIFKKLYIGFLQNLTILLLCDLLNKQRKLCRYIILWFAINRRGTMEGQLLQNHLQDAIETQCLNIPGVPPYLTRKWYFSKQEIEHHSPSMKDGIEYEQESALRKFYCSFLQELGMELKV